MKRSSTELRSLSRPGRGNPGLASGFCGRCERCLIVLLLAVCCGCPQEAPAPPDAPAGENSPGATASSEDKPANTASSETPADPDFVPPTIRIEPPPAVETPVVERVVRGASVIPHYDAQALQAEGIARYESQRMILYTDIEPEIAETLLPLIDQIYPQWEEFFRPLPPARDDSEFRIVGYLMRDVTRFNRLGMIDPRLPVFTTGRHRGNRFWMIDQKTDYFRRHLLLHEATHCFMTIVEGVKCPIWYLEGTAELFGTHRLRDDGSLECRVMPDDKKVFEGWGRIALVRLARERGSLNTIDQVFATKPINTEQEPTEYAWCWAANYFLSTHPRYAKAYRDLRDHWYDGRFRETLIEGIGEDVGLLRLEWLLFAANLHEGFDVASAAIDKRPVAPIETEPVDVEVDANRGWQSSGWRLSAGEMYDVFADGQFVLDAQPKLWVSEPQGITVRYFDGKPLGRLMGLILDESSLTGSAKLSADGLASLTPIDLGRRTTLRAPRSGTLYLRLNDAWGDLADNTGTVTVRISRSSRDAE